MQQEKHRKAMFGNVLQSLEVLSLFKLYMYLLVCRIILGFARLQGNGLRGRRTPKGDRCQAGVYCACVCVCQWVMVLSTGLHDPSCASLARHLQGRSTRAHLNERTHSHNCTQAELLKHENLERVTPTPLPNYRESWGKVVLESFSV